VRRGRLGRPVPLAPVLEPVADLSEGETGPPGQGPLLVRSGVPVLGVAILEGGARLLLEAVNRFLPVPNRLRQGKLFAQPVLVHSPQRPPSYLKQPLGYFKKLKLHAKVNIFTPFYQNQFFKLICCKKNRFVVIFREYFKRFNQL